MLELINQHASVIIALFSSSSVLLSVASVIKVFTQRKLNKSFDAFNLASNLSTNSVNTLNTQVAKVNEVLNDFKQIKELVEDLFDEIKKLNTEGILVEIKEGLQELETVKTALDFKDKLIESYSKDLNDIKIKLAEISGESGLIE